MAREEIVTKKVIIEETWVIREDSPKSEIYQLIEKHAVRIFLVIILMLELLDVVWKKVPHFQN